MLKFQQLIKENGIDPILIGCGMMVDVCLIVMTYISHIDKMSKYSLIYGILSVVVFCIVGLATVVYLVRVLNFRQVDKNSPENDIEQLRRIK